MESRFLNILALDTSNEYCSLALLSGGRLAVREVLAGQNHSEMILVMLEDVLQKEGMSMCEIGGIAFGAGPGSFTGLRIACGVAQGLAFGSDVPVVGIGTLHAMASTMAGDRIVACLDARMGEVYHAAFERIEGKLVCLSEPGLYRPHEVPLLDGDHWSGCGSGFSVPGLLERYQGAMVSVDEKARPHAREIAYLALEAFESGRGTDAALAAPLYVRNKVALKESER